MIEFGKPEMILLIPLFIAVTLLCHYSAQRIKRSIEVFHYPPVQRLVRIALKKGVRRHPWRGVSLALKTATVTIIAFSLASPTLLTFQEISETMNVPMVEEEGVAGGMVLAIDVSASMGIMDVAPSRLEAAKNVLVEFVQNSSENVRLGVVAFDSEIRHSLPLTRDREQIVSAIERLTASEALPCLEEFTDIGYGLQTSVDFLAPYEASNKTYVIVLVSDGFANYGYPDPITSVIKAAERARDMDIPIYTVHAAGMGQDSNPELMRRAADTTGGEFLASGSVEGLKDVLDLVGKYYAPTHTWSADVEVKTTIPVRRELGSMLMIGAALIILALWIGNYRHYRTAF